MSQQDDGEAAAGELCKLTLAQLKDLVQSEHLGVCCNTGGKHGRRKVDIARDISRARISGPGSTPTSSSSKQKPKEEATGKMLEATRLAVTDHTWCASKAAADFARARQWSLPPEGATASGKNGKFTVEDLRKVALASTAASAAPAYKMPGGSGGPLLTFGGQRVEKVVTVSNDGGLKQRSFATEWLADRIIQNETPLPGRWSLSSKPSLPAVSFEDECGRQLELLTSKVVEDGASFFGGKKKFVRRVYVAVSGPDLAPISLEAELEEIAAFSAVKSVRKLAARLELLHSTTTADHVFHSALSYMDFRVLHDAPVSRANGEEMGDGCGFIPDELLIKLLGDVSKIVAIQVRVVAPRLGVIKGVLCRKQGITQIELPPSMIKVGPSVIESTPEKTVDRDWAMVTLKTVHPTSTNREIGKSVMGGKPLDTTKFKPLSDMVTRLWAALGVPEGCIKTAKRKHDYSWVVGCADPTGELEEGHVYTTGFGNTHVARERLFVTRSPCVLPTDGRVLPNLAAKPQGMSDGVWQWLEALPFGAILFSTKGDGVPMPATISDGDLDGDYYFVCWDEGLLAAVQPRDPVCEASYEETAKVTAAKLQGKACSGGIGRGWLNATQEHLQDLDLLDEDAMIGRIYSKMTQYVDESGMDNPSALHLARAYLQALDRPKHGGIISLPENLRAEVGL